MEASLTLLMHLNLGKTHVLTHHGIIQADGHILNGRRLIRQITTTKPTFKKAGVSETLYYLDEKDVPTFSKFIELQTYYESQTVIPNAK